MPLRFEIPTWIWADETWLSVWLKVRGIRSFFWEESRNADYVTIEVID